MRYFGKVEGGYHECYDQARKLLGRSNRGWVYLVWKWEGEHGDGNVARHDKGLRLENKYSWDAAISYAPAMHMMRWIDAEGD